jgi:hypothetical protein
MQFDSYVDNIIEIITEQTDDKVFLSTSDLYNFYYLATLQSLGKINDDYSRFIAHEFFNYIKKKYLILFGDLVAKQIAKYITRKRIDPDVTFERLSNNSKNYKELNEMMNHTYRSDMRRRNTVWNIVTENLYKLSESSDIKSICFHVDLINNCIHNTGELLFSKFSNAYELLRTFDEIHDAKSLNAYKNKVKKDIREIE